MQSFVIEFETDDKFSLNKVWSWWRWMQWVRKKMADNWHYSTEVEIEKQKIKKVKNPCILVFSYIFLKNMLDSSNCVAMSKMVEDALARNWILDWDTNDSVIATINASILLPLNERKNLPYNILEVKIFEEWVDKEYNIIKNITNINLWKN